MCNPIDWLGRGIDYAMAEGQKMAVEAIIVTAKVTSNVNGIRTLANAVVASVDALDLFGAPVGAFGTLVQSCKSLNKGIGAIKILDDASKFADGSAMVNLVRMASRIVFLAYDILTSLEWLESMALVAKGTANAIAEPLFGTTAQNILPTIGFVGLSIDLVDHLNTFAEQGLSWDTGYAIGTDLAKMAAIAFTVIPGPIGICGRIAATATATVIVFARASR